METLEGKVASTTVSESGAMSAALLVDGECPRFAVADSLRARLREAQRHKAICRFTIDGSTLVDVEVIG